MDDARETNASQTHTPIVLIHGLRELPLSTLRSAAYVLANPLNRRKAVPFGEKQFRYAFGNTLSPEKARAAHERYAVPAAARVLFQGANANINPRSPFRVDFHTDRAPLLFVGGGLDHVVPAKLSRKMAGKYAKSHGDGIQGVPGSLALHRRRGRLGGGCRLHAHVGPRGDLDLGSLPPAAGGSIIRDVTAAGRVA